VSIPVSGIFFALKVIFVFMKEKKENGKRQRILPPRHFIF
jgi:hypothetical protein